MAMLIEASCGSGSGTPRDAPNQPPFQLSSLDQHCDDQTAAAMLSNVEAEYDLTLVARGDINLPPHIPLTIRLTYDRGKVTCYPEIDPPPWSTAPIIFAQIGIIVEMQFLTERGAFAERFETEIKGRRGSVSFEYSTTPDQIKGTYRPDLPGYQEVMVGFAGNFFAGPQTNGEVSQSGIPPGHVSELIPVAVWTTLG
jgi:hypothetical protein